LANVEDVNAGQASFLAQFAQSKRLQPVRLELRFLEASFKLLGDMKKTLPDDKHRGSMFELVVAIRTQADFLFNVQGGTRSTARNRTNPI
jgi:hypothetical protein